MFRFFSSIALSLLIALGCAAATPKADNVLLIVLDGWAGWTYADSDMPFVKSLADRGALTLEKRSALPSASAINWATLFMGVDPEVHGYLHWDTQHSEMPVPTGTDSVHGIFPTIFQVARLQRPAADIAGFYEWDGVKHTMDTLAFTHHEQAPYDRLAAVAADYIRAHKPMLTMVGFDRPDHPGHDNGWGSPEYHAMMNYLDGQIKELYKAVEDAGMADNTLVIITADHGGINKTHGGITMEEMNSPLIMFGPGIKPGTRITDMVLGIDVAPTVADRLGLKVPRCWRGRPILADD